MGRNYARKDTPVSSDLALIWDSTNSDWRLAPLSGLATAISGLISSIASAMQKPTSQYLSPLTGFSLTLTGTSDIHLILTPAGTLATGEITLPVSPGVVDKQRVIVTSTQEITTLTITGNGASLIGEPTTIAAEGYFTLKYDMQTNTWYRVG